MKAGSWADTGSLFESAAVPGCASPDREITASSVLRTAEFLDMGFLGWNGQSSFKHRITPDVRLRNRFGGHSALLGVINPVTHSAGCIACRYCAHCAHCGRSARRQSGADIVRHVRGVWMTAIRQHNSLVVRARIRRE